MTRLLIIAFAAAVAASPALAASPGGTTGAQAAGPAVAVTQPLRVQPWHLLRHDGAELYQELCASCHGADGAGYGPAAEALPVPAPALTHLRRANVPREHWTYVITAGCEDHHHWAPDGTQTMPCWQRIFRQALGNNAAPLMVSTRLVDYLESIQE
jgi:mono/diheme cytochrome c family protein